MEELEHILSLTRDWRYPATNNRLQPADWAFDVTDFAENQWSYFGHFGKFRKISENFIFWSFRHLNVKK